MTLETLSDVVRQVRDLRAAVLYADMTDGLPPRAENDVLKAMALLELAACEFQAADYHRMQKQ